jgi:hypothetical protein
MGVAAAAVQEMVLALLARLIDTGAVEEVEG